MKHTEDIKNTALSMRRNGSSLLSIHKVLGLPKATLSGWFKGLELSSSQKEKLIANKLHSLNLARNKAALTNKQLRQSREERAQSKARDILISLDIKDRNLRLLALSMLYMGEGFKGSNMGIANSDPLVLNFYIRVLEEEYSISRVNLKCRLHIRHDQNPEELKSYWSKAINMPMGNFMAINVDKRTIGRPTFNDYKGVCVVTGGNIAIKRELIYLCREFCESIAMRAVSSVGRAQH